MSAFPTQENEGIRLRLVIRDPQLSALPWEYAYFSLGEQEGRLSPYLALHPAVSIVRHEARPVPHTSLLAPGHSFRVLAVSACKLPSLPVLSGMEAAVIGRALQESQASDHSGLRFELMLLDDPVTEVGLQESLNGSFDLFQFSGHSVSRRLLDGSSLLGLAVSDGRGSSQLLAPDQLAAMLLTSSVRVALLNVCSPPDAVGTDRLALGARLVEAGIPAVIAMQFPVEDSHAIAFSKGFYSALAAGLSLDEAVSLGRRRMHELGIMADWGAPVTFSRSPDGRVFAPHQFSTTKDNRPVSTRTALTMAYQSGRTVPPQGPIEPEISATITGFCTRWHPPEIRDERAEINALSISGRADGDVRDILRLLGSAYPEAVQEDELSRILKFKDHRNLAALRRQANQFLKTQHAGQLSQFSIELLEETVGSRPKRNRYYSLQRMPIAELLDHSPEAHVGLDYNLRHALSLYDVGRYGESLALMVSMLDSLENRAGTLTIPENALFFYWFSKALLKLNWYEELQSVLEGPYLRLSHSVLKDLEVERLHVSGIRFRQLGDPIAAQACFDAAVNILLSMRKSNQPVILRALGDTHSLQAQCRLDQAVSERHPALVRIASLRTAGEAYGRAKSYFEQLRQISGSGTHHEGRLNGTGAFLGVARSLLEPEAITSEYWGELESLARGGFEPERERKPFGIVAGKYAMSIVLLAKARWHSLAPQGHGDAAAHAALEQATFLLRSVFEDYLEPGRVQLGATFEMPKVQLAVSSVEELHSMGHLDSHAWREISARDAVWSPIV